MEAIARGVAPELARELPALRLWLDSPHGIVARIRAELAARNAHPTRTVVLVPYAQLMRQGRQMWLRFHQEQAIAAAFVPRFETTMNWAGALKTALPAAEDLSGERARDLMVAQALLERSGLSARRELLAGRLLDAARQIAPSAAAIGRNRRGAWAAALAPRIAADLQGPGLAIEHALARLALEWVAASSHPTDRLFDADVQDSLDCVVLLEGYQRDPVWQALKESLGERAAAVPLAVAASAYPVEISLHVARNAEDEAQRAAACVLQHIEAGRWPVALADTDRATTRRVHAMLAERVPVRDETGWKLSTTRAGAGLMAALRACAWNASTDAVLDWLKHAAAFDPSAVAMLEHELRKAAKRDWRAFIAIKKIAKALPEGLLDAIAKLRQDMQQARPLTQWLEAMQRLLQGGGQWTHLTADHAGKEVLLALRSAPGESGEWAKSLVHSALTEPVLRRRMPLPDFVAWVSAVLEAESFQPSNPGEAQLVILPFPQLLGRPFAALVMPGCDEARLAAWPEPDGAWTSGQRAALALPSREDLALERRTAWSVALQAPVCDLLWRAADASGDKLVASPLVQALELDGLTRMAGDPREVRTVQAQPTARPRPATRLLPITRISASAYNDLRQCPYRFFALRQLGLTEVDELDTELGKRDFGLWLHAVLRHFHDELHVAPVAGLVERRKALERAAAAATQALDLDEGEFLPFAAAWPRARDGYLDWLQTHEQQGMAFASAEKAHEQPIGDFTLFGRIDRIDRQADGSLLLLDYKTESLEKTKKRMARPEEDTQLAFYAALLPDDTLAAAYVNVGEKGVTQTVDHATVVAHRDALVGTLVHDLGRIAEGAALPALGTGIACEFCGARGLCRRDFWETE